MLSIRKRLLTPPLGNRIFTSLEFQLLSTFAAEHTPVIRQDGQALQPKRIKQLVLQALADNKGDSGFSGEYLDSSKGSVTLFTSKCQPETALSFDPTDR